MKIGPVPRKGNSFLDVLLGFLGFLFGERQIEGTEEELKQIRESWRWEILEETKQK